jgi:hypothetical protein
MRSYQLRTAGVAIMDSEDVYPGYSGYKKWFCDILTL